MNHWPLGLSTGSLYPHLATEAAVATIAALGFETCECYFQSHSENLAPFHRTLQAALRAAGLTIHSVHTDTRYFDFCSPYARRRQDAFDLFAHAIDGAASLGARCINWHGPSQEDLRRGASFLEIADIAARLATRAQTVGVQLTLENVSWCAVRTVEDVTWWQSQKLPLGFCYDPFQAAETLADPTLHGNADPLALLHAMGPDLATFHASDYHPTAHRHLPPGEGQLPWADLLATLPTIAYTGPIIIEPAHLSSDDHTRLLAGGTFLRHLIAPTQNSAT